ncbi:efflux transporter outer membrane subunit [Caenimonas terrae]|uniref:Efflux transporter outer membrane subunit n=1 Tax=Caenimonas terrae TaxID=696074 RepID=A0ABW0NDB3_9BURK
MTHRNPRLAALAAALLLAGCANMAGIEPQARLRDDASLNLPAAAAEAPLAVQWWRAFGDEQLDRLIEQALADNPNLRIAQARLARARAAGEVAGAALLPQVNGQFDAMHQRYSETGLLPPPIAGSVRDSATLQLGAGWELDFFGKNRALLEGALGAVRAQQAETDAARILLASNVARSYFQLARVDEQLVVARRTLAQREEALRLVRDRVNAGLDTSLELRQSEGGLPEGRQQIEALQEQATLARNALGALVGKPNTDVVATAPRLADIKPLATAAVIPANLLGLRADVAAARWRVEAAGQDVRSAKAQFYPDINLSAFAGLSSIGLGNLLQAGSLQWGVGPAIRLPIFEGGKLRANLRGKTADYDAAVESYNATVIEAIHEVGDQLASGRSIALQQAEQKQAQASAEGAYDIAVQRYKAGLGNYLNVLTAENAVLAQRRLAVDLAARALDTQVGLARALGGGYVPPADAVAAANDKN